MGAPPLPGAAALRQRWLDAVFLHWRVPPSSVSRLLPDGVRPDTLDGATYVGLVSFRLLDAGLPVGPALLPPFVETNVRLYGIDREGRRGVVFLSMDVGSAVMAATGRAAGLPYRWARAAHRADGPAGAVHRYLTLVPHRGTPRLTSRIAVERGPEREPDDLDTFLTARWGLHVRRFGRTWYLRNTHEPWRLHHAGLLQLHDDLVPTAGFPHLAGRAPDHVAYSPGVSAVFGTPRHARESQTSS